MSFWLSLFFGENFSRLLFFLTFSLVFSFGVYVSFVIIRARKEKHKMNHRLFIKFPNPEISEQKRYFEYMRGFFGQVGAVLKKEHISFEIHKIQDHIDVVLSVSNKEILEPIKNYLTSIEGIYFEQAEGQDPLDIYTHEKPFLKRLVLSEDYYALNCHETNFFKQVVDYLASLPKNESGGLVGVFRPVKPHKVWRIKNELQKRDELAREEVNTTNLNIEKQSIQHKISSNLFQCEFYTIGTSKIIAKSLASTFFVLNGENKFLIKRFHDFDRIKKRYLPFENLFNALSRRRFIGSYLNAEELATMFHPATVERGRYQSQDIKVLEARPEFLEMGENNILLGTSTLKTGKKCRVFYPLENLERHIYLAGRTGAGKSTILILLYLALFEKAKDKALLMFDPHGSDLIEIALRAKDWRNLVYFNLAETKKNRIITMNPLFSFRLNQKEKESKIENILYIFMEQTKEKGQSLGPSLEKILIFLIETGIHFADAYYLYLTDKMSVDPARAEELVNERQLTLPDLQHVLRDGAEYKQTMQRIFAGYPHEISFKWTKGLSDYFLNKPILDGVENRLRSIITPSLVPLFEGNKFKINELIKQKKRILFPLTAQSFGKISSKLIAKLILSDMWNHAQQITHEKDRDESVVFIDEFQTAQIPLIDDLLSQARKYKIRLVFGNQYLGQLEKDIKDSVMGNVSTFFAFGMGNTEEAGKVTPLFKDKITKAELVNLRPFVGYMRTINPYFQETSLMSFETIDYRGNIRKSHPDEALNELNEACLERYGEDIEELQKKHFAKLDNAERYFLERLLI